MEKMLKVINPLGLHARPAAKVVDCAARFTSDIRISYQDQEIDAKSIMSVLMLAAPFDADLNVAITGDDDNEWRRRQHNDAEHGVTASLK